MTLKRLLATRRQSQNAANEAEIDLDWNDALIEWIKREPFDPDEPPPNYPWTERHAGPAANTQTTP